MDNANGAVILTEMEDDSILAKIMAYLRKNSGGEDIYTRWRSEMFDKQIWKIDRK